MGPAPESRHPRQSAPPRSTAVCPPFPVDAPSDYSQRSPARSRSSRSPRECEPLRPRTTPPAHALRERRRRYKSVPVRPCLAESAKIQRGPPCATTRPLAFLPPEFPRGVRVPPPRPSPKYFASRSCEPCARPADGFFRIREGPRQKSPVGPLATRVAAPRGKGSKPAKRRHASAHSPHAVP